MPKSQCKTCGEMFWLCIQNTSTVDAESMCPICQVVCPADVIEMHASACNERPSTVEEHSFDSSGVDLEATEGPSGSSSQIAPLQNQQTSSSGPSDTTNKTEGL
ncbi:unnamed protein product [Boreogadus saida]